MHHLGRWLIVSLLMGVMLFLPGRQVLRQRLETPTVCIPASSGPVSTPPQTKVSFTSPDQHWVVFADDIPSDSAIETRRYWLAQVQCSQAVDPVLLVQPEWTGVQMLGFTADSSALFFSVYGDIPKDNVWVVPLPNLQARRIVYTDLVRFVEWAPDGRHLLIVNLNQGADLIGADGIVESIIPAGAFTGTGARNIAWSPAGDQIAYVQNGQYASYIMEVNNQEPARVWIAEIKSKQRRLVYTTEGATYFQPDWSPNGETIALWGTNLLKKVDQVVMVSSDGRRTPSFDLPAGTSVITPGWSPDGTLYAFVYGRNLGLVTMPEATFAEISLEGEWGIGMLFDVNIKGWTADSRAVILNTVQDKGNLEVQVPVR